MPRAAPCDPPREGSLEELPTPFHLFTLEPPIKTPASDTREMSARWQKLHISNRAPAPPLFYRYTLFRDGYELYLTDLTYIWSERPNRQHILGRAVEEDATIDPSQDIDQFNILLEKLGEALRNDPGTSTVLRRGRENDTLHLTTTTSLPAPLEPLKWNFYMAREKQRFSTTQLLIPHIKSEAAWELRQRELIEVVKRKDWLLSKLLDKLEAVGLDLSTIFPSIPGLRANHKGSTQSQAAKYVSGARPFDEDAWLEENNAITSETGFASTILEETEDSTLDDNLLLLEDLSAPSEGWWRKMSTVNNNTEAVDARTPEDSTNMDTTDGGLETEDDFDDDDDDDFEVRTFPRNAVPCIHISHFSDKRPPRDSDLSQTTKLPLQGQARTQQQKVKMTLKIEMGDQVQRSLRHHETLPGALEQSEATENSPHNQNRLKHHQH